MKNSKYMKTKKESRVYEIHQSLYTRVFQIHLKINLFSNVFFSRYPVEIHLNTNLYPNVNTFE